MVRVPFIIQKIFCKAIWRIETSEKVVFLTFDDGPTSFTPRLITLLDELETPATFFYLGAKAEKGKPSLPSSIMEGNHAYLHLNGWKTQTEAYIKNVEKNVFVEEHNLFRPPYGKMKLSQYNRLKKRYTLIMWSILSKDYDLHLSNEKVINNVIKNLHKGAIIVMHDQEKLRDRMEIVLPQIITKIKEKGYRIAHLENYLPL